MPWIFIEIMHMRHRFDIHTHLVEGLVLDHGSTYPDMKKCVENDADSQQPSDQVIECSD
jgi:hypothetical protein